MTDEHNEKLRLAKLNNRMWVIESQEQEEQKEKIREML
jgi:hypothetical protein